MRVRVLVGMCFVEITYFGVRVPDSGLIISSSCF